MLTNEELYEGFPKETAMAYRQEAMEKWGTQVVEDSENKLRQLSKADYKKLQATGENINAAIAGLIHLDPTHPKVQQQIARHYAHILDYWAASVGKDSLADAYRGLAKLYVEDERYTARDGQPNPAYAAFISKAMIFYADTQLG